MTLVGQIRNISAQATNITYKLDDGTGSIEVKIWMDSDNPDANPSRTKLIENSYCRAWGKLKNFGNKRMVGAHIIRPVEDMDEVSYHLLDATATHLYITKGPPGRAAPSGGAATNGAYQQTSGEYGSADMSGYTPAARKVYKYLRETEQGNEGLHQQEIAAQTGLELAEVTKAGDALLEGGLIYTTVDDQTWSVLDAD
jgi:replication factor A2